MPTIEVNGTQLYYTKQGDGPPLLLIHGTGGNADVFAAVVDKLARSYTVIAYDRRAFSRSGAKPHPPRGYFSNQAADAAALLKALGCAPANVFGWSGGGLVALALAIEHPSSVARLALYEPPYLAKKHPSLGFTLAFIQIMAARAVGRLKGA